MYSADEVEVTFDSVEWLVGEDNDSTISATRSILFNALDGVLAKDFLPQISVYGYTLASWTSGEQVVEVDAETKLLDLILALNNSFTQDIELSFSANFDANKHQITFNTDGGTPQPEQMPVTYGQPVGVLPTVTKVGYGFIAWVDEEGQTYTQETIYAVDEDITLTATWGVGIYNLKVTISHASVEIKDSANRVMTPDGGNYRLSYTESYTITVTPDAGYNVSGEWTQSQPASFELSYVGEGYTSASLTNLSGDGSITIPVEAILNTITLNGISHAQVSVKVGEDGSQQLESSDGVFTFTAHTDESVEITITPDEGYSVAYDEITSGTGYVSSQSDNVYAFKAFTSDVEIAFKTTANTYLATFSYSSGATSVGIISGGESQGQGILVSTGTNLVVKPNFEYGYEFASVSAEGATYSVDDETGNITFSNFTKAFTVTITGKPTAFALKATVFAIDSDHNVQDAQGFAATVKESELFGSEVTFTASKPAEASGYRFVGWFEGTLEAEEGVLNYNTEDIISTDESYKWVVAGERELTAVYEYAIFTIRAYVEGKGQIIYNENVVADSENGLYFSQQFNYSNEIVLNAQPASGYEFKEWRNGDQTYSTQQQLSITVDQDLSLTAVFVAGDLTFNLEAGVLIDGALYTGESVEGLSYGKVEWGTYSEDGGFVKDPDGDETTVPTKTDASVYVQVTVNKGYTFDNIYPVQGGREGEINLISSTESDEKIVNIYQITSLSAEFDGEYSFVATFVAQTTTFNIIFQEKVADNEYRQIDAGRIVVDSSAGVKPSGSNSSNVVVDAVTETTFKVTANLRFGMSFVDTNMVSATVGTISDPTVSPISDISSGLVSSLTFTVSGFTGSEATIVIYVTSATYSINFVEYDAEKEQTISLGTLDSIKIGDKLTLPEGMAIPTKDDYAFIGFYSDTLGDGEQYMDSTGNGIIWSQNGYKWDTHGYAKLSNFTPSQDGDGGTFTLYAVFVINKSAITISAVPSEIQDVPPTVGARVIITNFSDANTWMDDAQPFYVEVLYKASINISAPIYADYQFAYWQIEKTNDRGETEIEINENATIEGLGHYGYPQIKLVANYNARVAVTATAGGSVYYTYEVEGDEGLTEEVRVDGEAYVPTTSAVTLHAQPANGYLFKGWYKGDELVSTEPDCRLDTPTLAATYHAEFEGETVTIHIGEYDSTYAHITSIMANGSDVNFSTGSFQARVGDEIAIYLSQLPDNFEIVWEGADIQNLISHYGYVVDIEDFTDYELTITPVISQMRGTVTITVSLEGKTLEGETDEAVDETELANAGTVSYINADGGKVDVIGSVEFEGLIGDALQIEIIAKEYYKVGSVVYNGADVTANIDPETNILILTLSLNAAKTFKITVNFIRDMWIDYAGDDYNLVGDGTGDNPYIISSAEDLSYIAHMINERGNTNFAEANYKLGANIDLTGKYWSPIGTEDNRFNGTFDYSAYSISNVRVDPAYEGDLARDGVFGYLGDRATFPEANNDLMIALIIVGVIIFLILLALLIFLLIRRKRKKELEELANS